MTLIRPDKIPLALYMHLPWCVRKCPYCDFNSHAVRSAIPEKAYVRALLADLEQDLVHAGERVIQSIFIGGGTPSLFSPQAIDELLQGVRAQTTVLPDAEITLEANPGAADQTRFTGFRTAGVNRLSIGVQSFDNRSLHAIGRIHDGQTARDAARFAAEAGFENINLDLMFGLPGQTLEDALRDVETAIAFAPAHISHYQLTLEPGTAFYHRPPVLPTDDTAWEMQESCARALRRAGYRQYEVSAWAQPGRRCAHNLNYWRFGDYLGIGAGAHGKLTRANCEVWRTEKVKHPNYYLSRADSAQRVAARHGVDSAGRGFEFMLNALRLNDGASLRCFQTRTGLSPVYFAETLTRAKSRGLLDTRGDRFRASALGRRFLNDLIAEFLPDSRRAA